VRTLGLDRMLAFVAGYDSGFGTKPAPGPVLAFSAAVDVCPEEIVMVGDTASDVITARAAGARAILVLTGPRSPDYLQRAGAEAVIVSIAQLPAWLESQRSASYGNSERDSI
jgi:phosphoglycolate phosphatase